jgi:hypothetical protein
MMQNEEYFRNYVEMIDSFCDSLENIKERDYIQRDQAGWLRDDIKQTFEALLICHFEIPYFEKTSKFFVEIGIDRTIEYFYGDWREGYREFDYEKPMPREHWRYNLNWCSSFRYGLLFALLSQDKEPLQRIVEWIENDLYYDKDSYSAQEMAFQLVIAYHIRGKSPKDYSEQVDLINKSHKQLPKMCLAIFDTMIKQDISGFEKMVCKLVKWHIKNLIRKYPDRPKLKVNPVEFRYHPENIVSLEASWLWNVARLSGMKIPTNLPEEIMDRIITPQSVGFITTTADYKK